MLSKCWDKSFITLVKILDSQAVLSTLLHYELGKTVDLFFIIYYLFTIGKKDAARFDCSENLCKPMPYCWTLADSETYKYRDMILRLYKEQWRDV